MMTAPSTGLASGPRTVPDRTGAGVGFGDGFAATGLGRGVAAAGLFGGGVDCVWEAARPKATLARLDPRTRDPRTVLIAEGSSPLL
jgi:hypothetical protein